MEDRLAVEIEEGSVVIRLFVAELNRRHPSAVTEDPPEQLLFVEFRQDANLVAPYLLVSGHPVERLAVEGEVGHERDPGVATYFGETSLLLARSRGGRREHEHRKSGDFE